MLTIFPELEPMEGRKQNNPHHAYDVWTHTVKTIANSPADPIYRLTMLFHDAGKPSVRTVGEDGFDHFKTHPSVSRRIAEEALLRMKSDRATIQQVTSLIQEHDLRIPAAPVNVKRQMVRIGSELFESLFPVFRADLRGQNPERIPEKEKAVDELETVFRSVVDENACVRVSDLSVNGKDMTALGAKGQEVGVLLKTLLDKVVSEEIPNARDALLESAQNILANFRRESAPE